MLDKNRDAFDPTLIATFQRSSAVATWPSGFLNPQHSQIDPACSWQCGDVETQ
jgi:hypothetical protein